VSETDDDALIKFDWRTDAWIFNSFSVLVFLLKIRSIHEILTEYLNFINKFLFY
jgi:hypothetical protein